MSLAAAAWCVVCGGPPELAITLERRGVLAHYGSCRHHLAAVAARARADIDRIDAEDEAERQRLAAMRYAEHDYDRARPPADLDWHDDVYPPELER